MNEKKYKYKFQIMLNNPNNIPRINEPVITKLSFPKHYIHKDGVQLYDNNDEEVNFQLFDVVLQGNFIKEASIVFIVQMNELTTSYWLYADQNPVSPKEIEQGIKTLPVNQSDGFKRLDTGYYLLELCTGTADGTSSGKWGIRYFEAKEEQKNLISGYSNAIGGFYGPFFTPKNGLVNPPEHTIANSTVEVEGPLYCRYIFEGTVPNGLDENLKNKKFKITWEFFYNTPWFKRKYEVDDFSTTIDEIPVSNKITVGDEFESGQGNRVFTTFASYGNTFYREGDPYAKLLADTIYQLVDNSNDQNNPGIKKYKEKIGGDINKLSWDYFWRIFCVQSDILNKEEIEKHAYNIIKESYKQVHKSRRNENVLSSKTVNVNLSPEQTIFPLSANKTAELNEETGYSMVWCTSNNVSRYQIVQREDSGWVNWGTNGENEYPELPVGSTIYTAYGKFENWESLADAMEKPIDAKLGIATVLH